MCGKYVHFFLFVRGDVFRVQVMLPDCEKLPPIGSKGSETCFRIGIPHLAHVVEGEFFLLA